MPTEPAHSSPARRALALAAAASASALLAACGSSAPGQTTSTSQLDAGLAFSRCMREHGVKDFPNPESAGGGALRLRFAEKPGQPGSVSPQTMEAAQHACRHFVEAFRPKLSPQEKVARDEQVRRFATCMREHGVNVHTSTSGDRIGIGIGGPNGGPNPESPTFQAAQKACQGLLPFKRTTTGQGGTAGPGLGPGG